MQDNKCNKVSGMGSTEHSGRKDQNFRRRKDQHFLYDRRQHGTVLRIEVSFK